MTIYVLDDEPVNGCLWGMEHVVAASEAVLDQFEAATFAEVWQAANSEPLTRTGTLKRFYLRHSSGRAYTMPGGLPEIFRPQRDRGLGAMVPEHYHAELKTALGLVWDHREFRRARQRLHPMSQAEFADAMGVSENTVARLERGEMAVTEFRKQAVRRLTEERLGCRWEPLMAFEEFVAWADGYVERIPFADVVNRSTTLCRVVVHTPSPHTWGEGGFWEIIVQVDPWLKTGVPSVRTSGEAFHPKTINVLRPDPLSYSLDELKQRIAEVVDIFSRMRGERNKG
jgi:transcriptional regulator with XRE-family HTH domain